MEKSRRVFGARFEQRDQRKIGRVVDQNVHGAKAPHGRGDQLVAVLGDPEIGVNRKSLASRVAFDFVRSLACGVEVSARDDDVRAGRREGAGYRAADPSAAAGDDDNLALKLQRRRAVRIGHELGLALAPARSSGIRRRRARRG